MRLHTQASLGFMSFAGLVIGAALGAHELFTFGQIVAFSVLGMASGASAWLVVRDWMLVSLFVIASLASPAMAADADRCVAASDETHEYRALREAVEGAKRPVSLSATGGSVTFSRWMHWAFRYWEGVTDVSHASRSDAGSKD